MTNAEVTLYAIEQFKKYGLVGWSFKINSNQRRLGVCKHTTKMIEVSRLHIEQHPDEEVKDTVRHEIAHALVDSKHGHDAVWRRKALELGCSAKRCGPALKIEPNYTATCPNCECKYAMLRKKLKLTYHCPSCGPSLGKLAIITTKKDNSFGSKPMQTLSKTSTQLVYRCTKCDKKAEIVNQLPFGKFFLVKLSCGHTITSDRLEVINVENDWTKFEDGRSLFPFQAVTLENIIRANGRCLLALDMGLGKTLCAIAATRKLFSQMRSILVVTKSTLMLQWFEEYLKSSGIEFAGCIIENSHQKPIPGYPITIVSYDMLRRMDTTDWNFKTVILDECQQIKNPSSQRTQQVREICANATYIIGTSGTPFKNNIDEYFTILNILRPDKHSNYAEFVRRWCKVVKRGKVTKIEGLKDPEAFLAYNEGFVFRFEREVVLPDLPKIFRHFRYTELDANVESAYDSINAQFQAYYDKVSASGGISFEAYTNILAFFAKMRHLAGLSKIKAGVDYVEEFLEQTDRKLTIFIHHKDVHDILSGRLEQLGIKVLNLRSSLDMNERHELINKFRTDETARVMIASTLASGEGLNLQFCSDCIMLERQWNPSNEEQCEARFPRPGSLASVVSALYIVAIGTIDEFLAELVEKKRQYLKEGLDGSTDIKWEESSLIKDLAEILSKKGRKRWSAR